MSHEAVQAVLERTLTDESFRARLFNEPEEVLGGFELTPDEAAALRALSLDTGAGENRDLDVRQSKRPFWTAGL